MSEMVERVAKAMCEAQDGDVWDVKFNVGDIGYLGRDDFRAMARAAIAAMREPTEAMVLANSDAAGPDDQGTVSDWRAMIDAALAEEVNP